MTFSYCRYKSTAAERIVLQLLRLSFSNHHIGDLVTKLVDRYGVHKFSLSRADHEITNIYSTATANKVGRYVPIRTKISVYNAQTQKFMSNRPVLPERKYEGGSHLPTVRKFTYFAKIAHITRPARTSIFLRIRFKTPTAFGRSQCAWNLVFAIINNRIMCNKISAATIS